MVSKGVLTPFDLKIKNSLPFFGALREKKTMKEKFIMGGAQ